MSLRKSTRTIVRTSTLFYGEKPIPKLATKSKSSMKKKNKTAAVTRTTKKLKASSDPSSSNVISAASATTISDEKSAELRTFDIQDAIDHLKVSDPKLAPYMTEESFEYLRKRLGNANTKNPFRALATSIIYQQIHGKAAAAICTRFIKLFDPPVPVPDIVNSDFDWFPTPKIVLDKTLEELKAAGLSTRKAEYIQSLAEKFRDCSVDIDRLQSMSDDELSQFLCSVKGIGQWTVDMFMIFNLGRPNVLPLTDLAVKKAVARHFGLPIGPKKFPTADEMCRVTKIWEPYRTVATLYMWRGSSTVISAD